MATGSEEPPPALGASCRALAGGLDNAAQVLAALAGGMGEGADGSHGLRRRLQQAAVNVEQAAELVRGRLHGESKLAGLLGIRPGAVPEGCGLLGRSEVIALPDFVGFVANLARDGVLEVSTTSGRFTLELRGGAVVYVAADTGPRMRLGEVLMELGHLDEDALDSALGEQREGERLGDTLLRLGLVDEGDLESALASQMYRLFARMHEVETGFDFRFDPGRRVMSETHARLATSQALLEGARLLDERCLSRAAEQAESDAEDGLGASWLADYGEEEGGLDIETFRQFVEVLFLEETLSLPCPPGNTSRFLRLTHRDDSDLEDVLRELARDPVLAAHVLRAFCASEQMRDAGAVSLRSAAQGLGRAGLRKVAVQQTLNGSALGLGTWEGAVVDLWRRAALAAEFGALLGRDLLGDAERGQLVALLQDVGKPVVLSAIHDVENECGCRLAPSAAGQVMEEFHQRTGLWLARRWLFPSWLAQVIGTHHSVGALDSETRLLARVAVAAQELAVATFLGTASNTTALAGSATFVELGLDAELLQVLFEERSEQAAAVDALRA